MEDHVEVTGTVFLLIGQHICWKCRSRQEVVALAAQELKLLDPIVEEEKSDKDLVILSEIEEMPQALASYIQDRHPRYAKRFSRTAELSYFANSCECGALLGDHYMHSEPGGAFFPESEEDAATIRIVVLPFEPPIYVKSSYHQGSVGSLILEHGTRFANTIG
jgi:hypothetical protein